MISYRTSFNGLNIEVKGVYSAYNLTPEDIKDIQKRFNNQINGSGSNYTIYLNAQRYVWLKLFVHNVWIPLKFDIRSDLLKIMESDRIFERDVQAISKKLKEMRICLHVIYDVRNNEWSLKKEDKAYLLETIKNLL